MQRFTEQQQAAHQAIAEITADLGPGFVLQAVGDALAQMSRIETGTRGENLGHVARIVHQMAEVLSDQEE